MQTHDLRSLAAATFAQDPTRNARLTRSTVLEISRAVEEIAHDVHGPFAYVSGLQPGWDGRDDAHGLSFVARLDGDRHRSDAFGIPAAGEDADSTFCIFRGQHLSFGVFARPVGRDEELDDVLYDTAWTFEPSAVRGFTEDLVRRAERLDAERARAVGRDLLAVAQRTRRSAQEVALFDRIFARLDGSQRLVQLSARQAERAEAELAELRGRVHRLERRAQLGTAAASFAHEVNNALQHIVGSADAIDLDTQALRSMSREDRIASIRGKVDSVRSMSREISGATQRIASVTRGMLDLARAQEARVESVDAGRWLRKTTKALARTLGVEIDVRCHGENHVLRADPDRLHQILHNLVANACEAEPSRKPRIEIVCDLAATGASIEVSDDGPGIGPDEANAIFEAFRTSRAERGGNGLGLTIARAHARSMGGDLELARTGEVGTTFRIRLEAEEVRGRELALEEEDEAEEQGIGALALVRGLRRVLVVEDDADVRRTLGELLARLEIPHETVATARDAEARLQEGTFDAALVDYRLGEESDGFELARRWKEAGMLGEDACIVITGSDAVPAEERGRQVVLEKPFTLEHLVRALESAVSD